MFNTRSRTTPCQSAQFCDAVEDPQPTAPGTRGWMGCQQTRVTDQGQSKDRALPPGQARRHHWATLNCQPPALRGTPVTRIDLLSAATGSASVPSHPKHTPHQGFQSHRRAPPGGRHALRNRTAGRPGSYWSLPVTTRVSDPQGKGPVGNTGKRQWWCG